MATTKEVKLKEVKKTSLRLPTDLYNQLRHIAIDKNTDATSLVIEAIRLFLDQEKKRGLKKEKLL